MKQLFTQRINYRRDINDQGDGVVCIPNDGASSSCANWLHCLQPVGWSSSLMRLSRTLLQSTCDAILDVKGPTSIGHIRLTCCFPIIGGSTLKSNTENCSCQKPKNGEKSFLGYMEFRGLGTYGMIFAFHRCLIESRFADIPREGFMLTCYKNWTEQELQPLWMKIKKALTDLTSKAQVTASTLLLYLSHTCSAHFDMPETILCRGRCEVTTVAKIYVGICGIS